MAAMSFIPAGDIYPCRIVKMGSTDFSVLQASAATDKAIGVSQEGTEYPPNFVGSDGLAGRSGGQNIRVFTDQEICLLELGGTVSRGDYLKSDANGKGVVLALTETANTWYVGVAEESGVSGEKIRVLIKPSHCRPA